MAHDKNHIVRKQEQTIVEVDVPGKDLKILVPDNIYAYGDDKSVVQMTEDIVAVSYTHLTLPTIYSV